MMKRLFLNIFTVICAAFLAASCYEDLSTPSEFEYPDIEITASETADTLSLAFGDMYSMTAEAHQEGTDDADLSYLWEIDVTADSYKSRALLSETGEVEFKVNQTASNTPYILSLTVTNKNTGYIKVKSWVIYVTSSLGEGLLIGHTRDGGATSELDLISAPEVTYGYSAASPHITRDIFGILNPEGIQGRIQALESTTGTNLSVIPASSYNENLILIGTDKHLYALNPTNYSVLRMDGENFMGYPADEYIVTYAKNSGGVSCQMITNGRLTTCGSVLDHQFSTVPSPMADPAGFTPENFSAVTEVQGGVAVFDQQAKKFYGQQSWTLHSSSLVEITGEQTPAASFLADKTSVAAGEAISDNIFILRGPASDYYAVIMNNGSNKAAKTYALSGEDIDKAVSYAFCDNANVFFYATPDKIYSSLLSSDKFTTKALNWSPDSKKEKITHIYQYTQAWWGTRQYYPNGYEFILKATHRLQVIITTYNPETGEGKVYLKPFNVSTGMFNAFKDNGTYGGFGEITAVTSTMR